MIGPGVVGQGPLLCGQHRQKSGASFTFGWQWERQNILTIVPDFSLCECETSSDLPHFSRLEARTCLETHHSASIVKALLVFVF